MRYSLIAALYLSLAALPAYAQSAGTKPSPDYTPVPAEGQAEVNMKGTQNSKGASSSYLIKDAPLPGDFVMGKQTAPLIMIEYASLSCPHCAHFSNDILPELQKQYIDTGRMRYVLRQFPLNEPALKGAILLDCVGEQDKDKYFVFAKVLFDAQSKWAFDGNYMSGLENIATVGGLSKEQFQSCMSNTDREIKVLKIKKLATDELKVPHTPYIFIGGEAYEGPLTLEDISKFIEAKLAQNPRH